MRDDVVSENEDEIAGVGAGFCEPGEPDDVGPAIEWWEGLVGCFEFGGVVCFGDDGATGWDHLVVVVAEGGGLRKDISGWTG